MTSPTLTPAVFAVGDQVQVIAAPESGGIYGRLVGRSGRVTAVNDFRPHTLPIEDVLFDVLVPGFVAMPFSATELQPAPPTSAVGPVPRLIDCEVCAGSGVMAARSGSLRVLLDGGDGQRVLCPRCDGRGVFLELVVDVLPDLAVWGRT